MGVSGSLVADWLWKQTNVMLKTSFRQLRLHCIQILCGKRSLSLDTLGSNICILAPHPDDEAMGCGQLIAECCRRKMACRVIVISDGAGSHQECCDADAATISSGRQASCRKAVECLGLAADKLSFLGFPDGELQRIEGEIYERLMALLCDFKGAIFVPHDLEGWSAHLAVQRIGKRLAESTGSCLYSYCVWFYYSMPFCSFGKVKWSAARVLQNENALARKRAALAIYQNDKAPCGKPYAGVLPELLWKAVNGKREVYFEE